MRTDLFKYIRLFVGLVLLQVLILNNIRFGGYINPYIYVLFILMLPIDVSGWMLLLSSFLLGLTVDMFSDSSGMHAAAAVFAAFCRPAVIQLISVKADFESGTVPSIPDQGLSWIMLYSLLMILLHHIPLFFLEVFRFTDAGQTIMRILLSTAFSFAFVMMGFLLFGKTRKGSQLR